MTLEQRKELAGAMRAQGCNCAQAVIVPFTAELGIDPQTLRALTAALGSGVAATREICGVPNTIAIARGLVCDRKGMTKAQTVADARALIDRFSESNDNLLRCAELKGRPGCPTCNELIAQGIELLHESFENDRLK